MKKLLITLSMISLVVPLLYYLFGDVSLDYYIYFAVLGIALIAGAVWLNSSKCIHMCGTFLIYSGAVIILFASLKSGGIYSHLLPWLLVVALLSVFLYTRSTPIVIAVAFLAVVTLLTGYLNRAGLVSSNIFPVYIRTISILLQIFFVTLFAWLFKKERERNVLKIREQQNELAETSKLRAVSEMSKGLAHEINNPLTQIRGYLDLINEELETSKDTNNLKEHIEEISLGANKIASIISKTQEFTKNINFENKILTKVSLLIEQARILLKAKIERHKPVIEYADNDMEISCVPSLTIHALTNVLANAIDFVYKDGKSKIRIYVEKTDNTVNIVVEDNGQEIPSEIMPKIFEPFFTTKTMGKGIGLGLSMVYNIMQQQEGSVSCVSSSASTKFILSFPL
ncbi:MAG: GHKL domain-containing protein [Oligoflexia bacterium]|nr:GHKL domain-containing protein [Oligoflexia bacterium]